MGWIRLGAGLQRGRQVPINVIYGATCALSPLLLPIKAPSHRRTCHVICAFSFHIAPIINMLRIFLHLFLAFVGVLIIDNPCFAGEPWEISLPRDPAAREIIERRCKTDAKEVVYSTVEGVSSIFITIESDYAFEDTFIYTSSSGLSASKFWNGFYGPYTIETDGLRFFDSRENPDKLPVASITRDGKRIFQESRQSFITVSYQRESTDEEQLSGVYGRKITIKDEKNKIILGQRTEFFWLSPPGFKNGVRHEKAICPYIQPMAKSPAYFVKQVVNPVSDPCDRIYVEKYNAIEDWARKEFRETAKYGMDKSGMRKFSDEYNNKKEINHQELQACWIRVKNLPRQ